MEESLFVLTRPRIIAATIYTAFIGFLLAEKFWADYCYHIKNVLTWPDADLTKNLLWTLPLALLLLWFSFTYGRGKPPITSLSAILIEMFFTALVLYIAWSVGLLHNNPFKEFLKSASIFVVIVGLFAVVFRITAKSIPHFADWMIGCIILAIACFGYYRAVSDCLGLPKQQLWHLKDYINFWKDILVYVVIGAVLLQGVLRITLVINEKGPDTPLVVRAIFFGVYAIGCLIVVVVLAGAGDLMYLNSGEFKTMSLSRQELVRFHIYLRDVFIVIFAIGNSAWLYFKLFVG